MSETVAVAEVRLWNRTVGAVVETGDGQVSFEYDDEFRRSGLEISPRHLPLSARGPLTFPALARLEAFEGLPGVLADALPDRFGNAIIQRYFDSRGKPDAAFSPVQKLLYIGNRALGALTFRPAKRMARSERETEALEIADLVKAARHVVQGTTDVSVPEIIRLSASAGGARAKAIILWNREKNEVRSAFAKPRRGDEHWIIKFDGVGELDHPNPDPQPYNRIEYAYSQMAKRAGLEMAETMLLEERRLGHFMTKRFERDATGRLHFHSLGGMEHVDYNAPGIYSYEQYLRLVLDLELGHPAIEEAFRRVCFNVLAVNQDDHVKNLGFLMDGSGTWRLSPAYDLTFAKGRGYTRRHQMTLSGKRDGFTADDLLELGAKFGIRSKGRQIIEQVGAALDSWPSFALAAGVAKDRVREIDRAFRRSCIPAA